MKVSSLILMIFISFNSNAQEPVIRFDQVIPRWYHIAKDTTFVSPSPSGLNEYTAFTNWVPFLENNLTYSHSILRNELGEMDGGLVRKINSTDGTIDWTRMISSRHNYYQVMSQYILESSDTTISMIGMKRTNESHRPFPAWGNVYGYAVPWVIEIDKRNGNILSEKVDLNDTLGVNQILGAKIYFYGPKGKLIQLNIDESKFKLSEFDNNLLYFSPIQYLDFNKIVANSNIDGSTASAYSLNDSSFLLSYYIKSKENDIKKDEASLEIYKIQSDTFKLTTKINLLPFYVTRPVLTDFNENLKIILGGTEDVVLINSYKDPDNQFQYKNWVLWLDKNGNEKFYLKEIKLSDSEHVFSTVKGIYLDSHNVYIAAFPSMNGFHGFDILKINNEGKIEIVGSLTTNDDKNNLRSSNLYVDESGNVNMTIFWDKYFSTTLGFHLIDLGINLSSEDEKFVDPTPLLTVSPNPASDDITIYITDEKYRQGMVQIYNLAGQNMLQQKISHGETLNVRDLAVGSYIVQFRPDSRPGYFMTTKMVKGR